MVWSFHGQVLRDGNEASCQAAVARVVTYCRQQDSEPPTADTGDYCKARASFSQTALRDLTREFAGEVKDQAVPTWLFKDQYHAKFIDGFTFTMPDTEKNQKKFPHPRTQTRGAGCQSREPWPSCRWRRPV
ncbi:MAG: hypothetical protein H6822_13795 [Planctomycetaceae bacterium]|nr:hypothetical protein [Planctomycetaceae bacterium]